MLLMLSFVIGCGDLDGGEAADEGPVWGGAVAPGEVGAIGMEREARVSVLPPSEEVYVNDWLELPVEARVYDAQPGPSECAWWAEQDGVRAPVDVTTAPHTQPAASQWADPGGVCGGTVSLKGYAHGLLMLGVTVTTPDGAELEGEVSVGLNGKPSLTVEVTSKAVVQPGELVSVELVVSDHEQYPAGEEANLAWFDAAGAEIGEQSCTLGERSLCTLDLRAPAGPGEYTLVGEYLDAYGLLGAGSATFRVEAGASSE